jgi:hypothetical protein
MTVNGEGVWQRPIAGVAVFDTNLFDGDQLQIVALDQQGTILTSFELVARIGATAPPDSAAGVDWTVTRLTDLGYAEGLVFTGEEFIGVFSRDQDVSVWVSADGVEWQQRGRFNDWAWITEVVWSDGRLVAVGELVSEQDGERSVTPGVWVSADSGQSWTRGETAGHVRDIVATPFGFVAAGSLLGPSDEDFNISHGELWISKDGLTWEAGTTSEDPEGVSSTFDGLVWDGSSLTVLGRQGPHPVKEGSGLPDRPEPSAATWTTADGSEWTTVARPSDLTGYPVSVVASNGGIVAVTHWNTPEAKDNSGAWISQDGVTWDALPLGNGNWEFTDVQVLGDSVFILGNEIRNGTQSTVPPRIWMIDDSEELYQSVVDGEFYQSIIDELPLETWMVHIAGLEDHPVAIGDLQTSSGVETIVTSWGASTDQ